MHPDVRAFLADYPPDIQAIARELRTVVLKAFPAALEQVDRPAKMLAYGRDATYKGLVCVIMPQRGYVNLGFARGASLPDPNGLLKGTGKRARHIKVRSVAEASAPGVLALLEAALRPA